MQTNILKFLTGFTIAGLVLVAASFMMTNIASAQTQPVAKKATTTAKKLVAKKPATTVKKPAKKPVAKVPVKVVAPAKFLKAGWIPYWTKNAGSTETTENLSKLDIISPFSYEVDGDGFLIDKLKVQSEPWPTLFAEAKAKQIQIYPTIAWFKRSEMQYVLNDEQLRTRHIAEIDTTILSNPAFDGVDIDYENKSAETKDGFSAFLRELKVITKAKNKKLICTIEPRTPIESRVRELTPEKLADSKIVSNDYVAINTHCDQVRIMTYDQRDADIKLHDEFDKLGTPYMPVADPVWVEKVIQLTIQDIAPSKIMLGIPTFGYKWELVPDSRGGYEYTKLRAINFREAYNNAKARGITIERNQAGELSYMYLAPESPSYAVASGAPLHLVWFPDAESMIDEINLAKKYKLGGISVFKFDGGADQSMWDVLNQK
jgi:spore germination protein